MVKIVLSYDHIMVHSTVNTLAALLWQYVKYWWNSGNFCVPYDDIQWTVITYDIWSLAMSHGNNESSSQEALPVTGSDGSRTTGSPGLISCTASGPCDLLAYSIFDVPMHTQLITIEVIFLMSSYITDSICQSNLDLQHILSCPNILPEMQAR